MKKVLGIVLCGFITLCISACGSKAANPVKNLCTEFETTKENYISSNLDREETVDKLEQYSTECPDEELRTCIALKAAVNTAKYANSGGEIAEAHLNEISRSYRLDAEKYE